eukprot:6266334-Pyramimonas_sp.AAC.1
MQAWCCGRNFTSLPRRGVAATRRMRRLLSREVHFGGSFKEHLFQLGTRIFWKCLNPDLNLSAVKSDETIRE